MGNYLDGIETLGTNIFGLVSSGVNVLFNMLVDINETTGAWSPTPAGMFILIGLILFILSYATGIFKIFTAKRR